MKRFKIKQSPFTPLLFLIIIMFGYVIGAKGEKAATLEPPMDKNLLADEALNEITSDHPMNIEVLQNLVNQKGEDKQEPSNHQENILESSSEEETPATSAESALATGVHITQKLDDSYAKQIVEDYCNRKVVACSSSNMVRTNEDWVYRQTFDSMTGYKGLVKLNALKETTISFQVATEMDAVTAVLIFPDQSYVALEINEKIVLDLPIGDSMLLYIGKNLSGSIEVKLEENDTIICKRM